MAHRIYVRNFDKPDIELDADESIVFERDGLVIRAYFDQSGDLKISADERVTISPEASNVFVVRPSDPLSRLAARRIRKALGAGDLDEISEDMAKDVRALVEAALR